MSQKFLTWATLTLGTTQAIKLNDSFELANLVLDEDIMEVAEQAYYKSGVDDPNELIAWTYGQALTYAIRGCQIFGVTIRTDSTIEDLVPINSILRTLIETSGDFQLAEQIVDLEQQELSQAETIAAMVGVVETWIDVEDILALIEDVSLKTIPRIINNCRSRLPPEEETFDEPRSPKYMKQLSTLMKMITLDSDVVDYYRAGGMVGYTLPQYLSVFGSYLTTLTDHDNLAKHFVFLYLLTDNEGIESRKELAKAMDVVVQDTQLAVNTGLRINQIFKELEL